VTHCRCLRALHPTSSPPVSSLWSSSAMAAPQLELSVHHLPCRHRGARPHPPRAAASAPHRPHPPQEAAPAPHRSHPHQAAASAITGTGGDITSFLASHRNHSFDHERASSSRVASLFLASHRNNSLGDAATTSHQRWPIVAARARGRPPSVRLRHGQPAPPHRVGARRCRHLPQLVYAAMKVGIKPLV
jgi:hypothetical protein